MQHYGYRYDYKARRVDVSMYLGPLPECAAQALAARLVSDKLCHMPIVPNLLTVNEYERGQGITPHVDCVPCFGPVACSIILGSQCVMELSSVQEDRAEALLLERCSLVVLAGDSRHAWRHAIPSRKVDRVEAFQVRNAFGELRPLGALSKDQRAQGADIIRQSVGIADARRQPAITSIRRGCEVADTSLVSSLRSTLWSKRCLLMGRHHARQC